jgi:hypothetical protein
MKTIKTELEKVIYDERRFNEAVKTICVDIENQSTAAIKTLRTNFASEITPEIDSLHTFSDEALFKAFIHSALESYIGAVRFMPDSEKNRINTLYDNLYSTCIDSVKSLQSLFALPYHLTYNGTSLLADKEEVSKKIRPNFIVELSAEERAYYSLTAEVVNALNAMHEFEEKHGYIQFSFNGINSLSRYGYLRKVNAMSFYQTFTPTIFVESIKTGTLGPEKDD